MRTKRVNNPQKQKLVNGVVTALWIINTLGILVVMLLGWLIYKAYISYMPPVEDLMKPGDRYATRVFSAGGAGMGR